VRASSLALRRFFAIILLAELALLVKPGEAQRAVEPQRSAYSADEVKAAFLYRFGTYVEWPGIKAEGDPIRIAVLGAPNVAMLLADYVPGRNIQGRPVEVRPITRIDDVRDAELLFIGSERSSMLAELVEALGKRPVLVVADAPDGLQHGAMVNFQLVDQRVRFEISLRNAKAAGLVLSSRLLSAAIRVETSSCWVDCLRVSPSRDFALVAASRPVSPWRAVARWRAMADFAQPRRSPLQ
jgi:hypothetical protein